MRWFGYTFLDGSFIDFIYSSLCFELISLKGVSIFLCRTQLVDSFGGTNLAWASMGLESHTLDSKGPHARSQRYAFGGLEYITKDLT
jgi:hypothetical protein